jgi:hypothetical protein
VSGRAGWGGASSARSGRGSARRRQLRQGCGPSPRVVAVASTAHAPRSSACHGAIAGPPGPAGQAPPDPYTRRLHRPTVAGRGSTADPPPTPVGARRCLARRAAGAADCRGVHRPRARCHRCRDDRPTTVLPALPGRRVRRSLTPTRAVGVPANVGVHAPYDGYLPNQCRGEALPRPPRRGRGDSAWPTRLARHAAPISRAAVSTIARP